MVDYLPARIQVVVIVTAITTAAEQLWPNHEPNHTVLTNDAILQAT
ncbi:MAG: hypothetical protein AAGB19_14715 [Cyanobacteria bacterium P01_F01_bin.3]